LVWIGPNLLFQVFFLLSSFHSLSLLFSNFYLFIYIYIYSDKYWDDPVRRKEFFDSFAKESKFDPLVPENWYSVSPQELREIKVC
jgi:hypothetical protein